MDIARLKALIGEAVAARATVEHEDGGRVIRVDAMAAAITAETAVSPEAASAKTVVSGAVAAPCFGIVHLSPAPGVEAFVRAGERVAAGQKLCLIEAMKVFTAVAADKAGQIAEIFVVSGDEVTRGQALFRLEAEGG